MSNASVSEENVELLRESIRAFNDRDIDRIVASGHPDVRIELFGGFAQLMGKRFEGPEGLRRFYTDWFATFETMHVEVEGLLQAGDLLVALTKLNATVRGSNAPVEVGGAIVNGFEDGKISRVDFYYDRDEALAAVGLRPED